MLLVRLQRPSAIPIESLFGRKEDFGRTIRLTAVDRAAPRQARRVLAAPAAVGTPRRVRPPARVQRDLGVEHKVNTILFSGVDQPTASSARPAGILAQDLGINVRPAADATSVIVDSSSGILSEPVESRHPDCSHEDRRDADSGVHVSCEQSADPRSRGAIFPDHGDPLDRVTGRPANRAGGCCRPLVYLNDWTARELAAHEGDELSLDYYLWDANAGLTTKTEKFRVAGIVPIQGFAADRQLAPEYPGSPARKALPSGIRHFRWTFRRSVRRTRSTGKITALRRRRS